MQLDDFNFGISVTEQVYSAADLMQLQMGDEQAFTPAGCVICTHTCNGGTIA